MLSLRQLNSVLRTIWAFGGTTGLKSPGEADEGLVMGADPGTEVGIEIWVP